MFWALYPSCFNEDLIFDSKKTKPQIAVGGTYIIEPDTDISDIGWKQLGVQTCENPKEEIHYTDISSHFGFEGDYFTTYSLEGGMALTNHNDEWWIWQIVSPGHVEGRNAQGDVLIVDAPNIPIRLYVDDIDQNGSNDMFIIGEFLVIVWDIHESSRETEVLIPFTPHISVRDVGIIDADGDGDYDIWAFIDGGEFDFEESHGGLWENIDNERIGEMVHMAQEGPWGFSWDGMVMDWDLDGDPDIYVCNDFGPRLGGNWVLINDGYGNFEPGDAFNADITTYCMGISVGDIDNNGLLDLYVTATGDQHLLQRYEDGFVEVTAAVGLGGFNDNQMLWGADITDYNNDGLADIFVATSELSSVNDENNLLPLLLFEQNTERKYKNKGIELGLTQETMSRIAISHDINNDGIEDLIASSASRLAHVYVSDGCTENNWIEIEGPESSIVQVVVGSEVWTHYITSSPGMSSYQPRSVHIGLRDIEEIDYISLRRPWHEPVFLIGPIQSNQKIIYRP